MPYVFMAFAPEADPGDARGLMELMKDNLGELRPAFIEKTNHAQQKTDGGSIP